MGQRGREARPRRIRTRAIVTAAAVLVAGAGTAVVVADNGSPAAGPSAESPIQSSVATVALTRTSGTSADLAARSTKPFSTVGVTWNGATTQIKGKVEVRTRSVATRAWTGWRTLSGDDTGITAAEVRPGALGGTAPMWVGPSNGVQVRVRATDGTTSLPEGLDVALVDPGERSRTANAGYAMDVTSDSPSPSDSSSDTAAASDSASPSDPASTPADPASPSDSASSPAAASSSASAASSSASASASASTPASASASASTSPSPSASATPNVPGLPTLAQAYPSSCTTETKAYPNPLPVAKTSTIPAPSVITRAGWGADECLRENGYPTYGTAVKVVFVHHTDDSNNYTCSQSASVVRAAYAYHVKVQGWRDIGYNFLVDKCGQIFEGRFGGYALPIIGAQTYGFNTNSMGIAAIGTYTDLTGGDSTASGNKGATPTSAMLGSIARIAAWKLGMYGYSPTGTNVLTEGGTYAGSGNKFQYGQQVTFNTVSGHRNGFATDCPGNQLYNALGTVRSYAVGPVGTVTVTSMSGGAAKSGSAWYTKGAATVSWTTATPSAVISGFDVLVDGAVKAHVGGGTRSAAISVAPGRHSITVRAIHISNKTTTSAAAVLVGDTTAPAFSTAPSVSLRTGTVSSTAVPVTVGWKATDNAALAKVAATAPSAATFSATTTSWATYGKPSTADLFTLRATDVAGNYATASVTRKPVVLQETSATKSGTWTKRASSSYLGGYALSSSSKGASLSWTVTGRSVALIASRASTSGQVYVYVDGVKLTTLDLKSSTTKYRQALWTKSWSSSAKHTVKVVVVATSGRPTVTFDGLAYLQ